jgi:hypothetical protein
MAIKAIKDLTDAEGGWGTISYNGYTFNGLRKFSLIGTDIYDDAGRSVVAVEYTLTVATFIYGADEPTQAGQMANIRQLLSTPGQALVITGTGVGDIQINGNTPTHIDVGWGPQPQSLDMGSPMPCVCELIWVCKFTVKECSGAASNRVMAWNYEVTYNIDDGGITTRIVSGFLQVRLTRLSLIHISEPTRPCH